MNHAIAIRWAEALEDPTARQTTGCLRDAQGECCLGVLCRVLEVPYKLEQQDWQSIPDGRYLFLEVDDERPTTKDFVAFEFLPDQVVTEADLNDAQGTPRKGHINLPGAAYSSLAKANDSHISFADIARWIRANWERL